MVSPKRSSLRPLRLRCEHLGDVRGLNTATPRFGWALEVTGGHRQTAWRIVAGDDIDDVANGKGSLWDSGKTPADCRKLLPWGGRPLARDSAFWWSVQVWDEEDVPSAFAEPAHIFTGLGADDWEAQWIGRYFVLPAGREVPQDNAYDNRFQARPADYLRREILLEETPLRATAYVTALGLYELYINGVRIGCDVMAPGWTDYHQRAEYQVHDVTEALSRGENCIGAILGEGWYSGRIGHNQRRAGNHYGGRPALLCQIHLEYADGRSERIVSDGTWMTRQGPICYSDFLAGEFYDARLELDNWSQPGVDSSRWQPAEPFIPEPDAPQLNAARAQPAREVARLDPVVRAQGPDSEIIFNFGQNLAGYIEMEVQAPAGTVFRLRHAERLEEDGSLYTANLRFAVSEDIYIAKGHGTEVFCPRFTFHGFQYASLTIEGEVQTDPRLTAIAIQTDTPTTGWMTTGNAMVNQLISNIFWSQRSNFLSVPTDCPQRDERYGWSADAQVFWRTAGYFMDIAAFLNKWMEDLIDGQSADGFFPDVAPTKPLNPYRLTPQPGAPAWGDGPIIMGWHHYLRYGDTDLLARCWEPFVAWMGTIEKANPDGIRRNAVFNNYGDWLSVGPESDRALVASAYWIHIADLMAKMAAVLSRPQKRWKALALRLRERFAAEFLGPDGFHTSDTQTAYLLALDFDLVTGEARAVLTSRLLDLLAEADNHLQTGFLGVRHLCPVLSDNGASDVAMTLLLNDRYPSWGFSIRQGATSIWERWDGWTQERGFQSPAMNSFNHYAYGAVGEWIWARIAGIDWCEDAPGFANLCMRPIFDDRLSPVSARYDAHTGQIDSNWQCDGDGYCWQVNLPPDVQGTVELPAGLVRASDGLRCFSLCSGTHDMKLVPDGRA